MQDKTENQIDKNFFVWDTAYYRWKCAGGIDTLSNLVVTIFGAIIVQLLFTN